MEKKARRESIHICSLLILLLSVFILLLELFFHIRISGCVAEESMIVLCVSNRVGHIILFFRISAEYHTHLCHL